MGIHDIWACVTYVEYLPRKNYVFLCINEGDYYGTGNNWEILGKKQVRTGQEAGENFHKF